MFGRKKREAKEKEIRRRLESIEYPKFNSVSPCPKCGYAEEDEDFEVRYAGQNSRYVGWETIRGGPERMKRICPRCGWHWYERTFEDSKDD